MPDLPLRKMPRKSDSSPATTPNPVNVGLRFAGHKALLASTTCLGGLVLARQDVAETTFHQSHLRARSSFAGEQDNLTVACSDEKRSKGEKCHDRPI
jgi:hypothetical protein